MRVPLARFPSTIAHPAAALCIVACLAALPAPAVAQEARATPSASELREAYPLYAPTAAPAPSSSTPAPTGEPAASSSTGAPPAQHTAEGGGLAADGEGTGGPSLVLVALALAAFAVGVALALFPRERRRGAGGGAGPWLAAIASTLRHPEPALPAGTATLRSTATREHDAAPTARLWKSEGPQGEQTPGERGRSPHALAPPAADHAWTAEIEWRQADGPPRFCVVAQATGKKQRAQIAQSPELDWPPTTPAAMRALSQAAEQLEVSLLSAGWTPLPPGTAWYAKRFAWEPGGAAPVRPAALRLERAAPAPTRLEDQRTADPADKRGRLQRWPKDTEGLWRCEIEWDAGYVKSRFKAVVHRPGQRRGHAIGSSTPFKWMLMGDPEPVVPRYATEVRKLAHALESAGWQRVGKGAAWYSERFVWRGEGVPPGHIEPAGAELKAAGDASDQDQDREST